MKTDNVVYLIDHSRLIDGFAELDASKVYVPLNTYCGICDEPFILHPRVQKYILEVRRVPVKMLRRGAVYCVACRRRRSRIRWLISCDRWRDQPNGREELDRLRAEERELKERSAWRHEQAEWPYPFDPGRRP